MSENKIKYPVYVLTITIVLLIVLSLFKTDFQIGNIVFKKLNVISDLQTKTIKAESKKVNSSIKLHKEEAEIPGDFLHSKDIIEYTDKNDDSGLKAFVKALSELKSGKRKKVRIGYFGDSMIEGDMISQDLRRLLQAYFGGKGVGFVPVTSISAANRGSIEHTFSSGWKDASFQNSDWGAKPFGFSGHVFYTKAADAWFQLKGVNSERLNNFFSVKLFYGKTDTSIAIKLNDSLYQLEKSTASNIQSFFFKNAKQKFNFNFGNNLNLPVYGASIESEAGITLDNYSFRGISGIELAEIPTSYFTTINEKYPYDLIILHYGPNLLFKPELVDFSWFENKMNKTIIHLKKHLPKTSFLFIGSADKASFTDGRWHTAAGVIPLIKTQNKLTQQYHAAFWNLYENMGGENSMVTWVDKKPTLATKDYTHFNYKGAQKVGSMLFDALLKNFQLHENKNK